MKDAGDSSPAHESNTCTICGQVSKSYRGPGQGQPIYLSASLDLESEILDTELRDLLEERLGLLRVLVDPRLALLEQLGAAALNHVAEQCPWGSAEAKQGHAAL